MPPQDDPFKGMLKFGDGLGLPDIWSGLHADAASWQRAEFAADTLRQRAGINDSSMALMQSLHDCECNRWQAFIETVGVTQIGAVALSWCKGSTLDDVSAALLQISRTASDLRERTLGLLNPQFHPPSRSISMLAQYAGQDAGKLAILVLSDVRMLENDVPKAWLDALPDSLRHILSRRLSGVSVGSM